MTIHARLTSSLLGCMVAVSLLFSGCSSNTPGGNQTASRATATAGITTPSPTALPPSPTPDPALSSTLTTPPTIPNISTISLGNFQAVFLASMARGLVLFGAPTGETPTNQSAYKNLYFYDFSTQQIRVLATATPASDGTMRGIGGFAVGGDWVVYIQYDQGSGHFELWAVNVVTNTRHLIDQESATSSGPADYATDGKDIVWSTGNLSTKDWVLQDYDLATGKVQLLQSNPDHMFQDITLISGLLYYSYVSDINGQTSFSGLLWPLDQSTPYQVPVSSPTNFALNNQYLVWDNGDALHTSYYYLPTGESKQGFVSDCIRPALAPDRPYMVCVDYNHSAFRLVRLPSGANTVFGQNQACPCSWGAIANDRVYWLVMPSGQNSSNQVSYFDLPTS